MKKSSYLIIGLTLFSFVSFSQEKTAWVGLTKIKTKFLFPSIPSDQAPVCLFTEQKTFSDSLAFSMLKGKVDSLLTAAGLIIIPEENVIHEERFKMRVAANQKLAREKDQLKSPPGVCKPGYGPVEGSGLGGINYTEDYYAISANPEILITAEFGFDLRLSDNKLDLITSIYVFGYAGKKQVFKIKSSYYDTKLIQIKPNIKSCGGYEIAEDIGPKQQKALEIAIGKLTEDLEKTKEKMQKYREKKSK